MQATDLQLLTDFLLMYYVLSAAKFIFYVITNFVE